MQKPTTHLHEAIEQKNLSAVKASIRDGAEVNRCLNRQTACTKAIDSSCGYDVISAIIESQSFNINVGNQFDRTPLHFAAKNGDCRLTRRLLQLGANVDQLDIMGVTPLGGAAWYDHVEVADCLLKHGASLDSKSYSEETALYRACMSDCYEMAEFLIHRGCNVNTKTNENHNHPGHTPLMACMSGVNYHVFTSLLNKRVSSAISVMKLIIQRGCDINFKDFRGRTALSLAVRNNNVCATLILLEAGCDVNIPDQSGLTPLDWALTISHQRFCMSQILVSYGARIDSLQSDNLQCDKPSISKLITSLQNTTRSRYKEPCLLALTHLLVSTCSPHSVESERALLANDGITDDLEGEAPKENFRTIVQNSELTLLSCCRYSIRKSLDSSVLDKIPKLPLPNRLKKYLQLDMDLTGSNPLHLNDLYIAIGENKMDHIKLLLESGINVDASFCGRVPLTLAAELGQHKAAEMLLSYGADPNSIDDTGESAMFLAVKNRHIGVVRTLLRSPVDLEKHPLEQRSPLLEAAFNGDEEIFELLLRAGADPSYTQSNGISSLHMMAGNGNVEMARLLLEKNVDPNIRDSNGANPLHVAASTGLLYANNFRFPALYRDNIVSDHIGVAKLLIENGCNVEQIVINVAQRSQPPNPDMIAFLEQVASS